MPSRPRSPSRPDRSSFGFGTWLLLVAVTCVLGVHGYIAAGRSVLDSAYFALQLFTLQGPDIADAPVTIQIARWTAAAVAGYALFRAAEVLFASQFQSLRLRSTRGHVVIVGLGWKARQYIHRFREPGPHQQTVVVIEKDRNSPYADDARAAGAHVLFGDADDPDVLARANLRAAAKLLCLADDMSNLKIAARVELQFGPERTPSHPLDCFLHLDDPVIVRNLRPIELRPSGGGFRQRVISLHEIAAPRMLRLGLRLTGEAAGPVTLAVVGLGAMGEALVLEAVAQWRMSQVGGVNGAAPRLTILAIDPAAADRVTSLRSRFPYIDRFCVLHPVVWDEHAALSDQCEFAFNSHGQTDIQAAYLCLPDEQTSLRAALRLGRRCHESGARFPIVLQLVSNPELGALFQVPNVCPTLGLVRVFSMFEETCRPAHLIGVAELIARIVHQFYVNEKIRQGHRLRSRPALCPWEELEAKFRDSNLNQVESLPDILAGCGYHIIRLKNPEAESLDFGSDLEELARQEHARYQQFLVASDSKTLATEWGSLSEPDREYTRGQVAMWPKMLAMAGFEIVKRSDIPVEDGHQPQPNGDVAGAQRRG